MSEEGGSEHKCEKRYRADVDACDFTYALEIGGSILLGLGSSLFTTPAGGGLIMTGTICLASLEHENCMQTAQRNREACYEDEEG